MISVQRDLTVLFPHYFLLAYVVVHRNAKKIDVNAKLEKPG